jgi:methylmalonyl-CoA epimerase
MTSLLDYRQRIDTLDEQILDLLGKRFAVVREVVEQTGADGVPMQRERLKEIRDRVLTRAENGELSPDFVVNLYDLITCETGELEDERAAANGAAPLSVAGSEGDDLGDRVLAIDHAAIAVRDLESAVTYLRDLFGFEVMEERRIEGSFSGMDSVVLQAGRVKLVLVQGTSPESNVSRYIEHYGPGVQHLAIEVDDAESLLEDLRRRGCDLLTGVIRSPGLDQIFTRRDPNSGMQIEFIARSRNDGFSDDNVRELFQAMERENAF